VEGDDLRVDILARPASRVLFTTTSAQKVYRARDWQSQSINLTARGDGLEWLPRETIVFSGAKGRLSLWVDVEPTSRFIGWDLVNFGAGAEFSEGILIQELTIKRAERLVFRERARVSGGDRFLPSALGYGGRSVAASLWALGRAGASDEDLLSQVASKVPQNQKGALTGITLRGGLLVARYLGSAMERAWDWLETVWRAIRELWGGRLFRPRLWST
jgi:urease accessory protein